MLPAELIDLPVVEVLDDVAAALTGGRDVLLVAPPGAGKTTAAPLRLVDEVWLDGRSIVVLEPRRLATRAAARRMAALVGQEVGGLVGFQTRDERHIGRSTRIEVVTEGVLTRRLQHDPSLDGVGLVVFDEVHERNLPTDLGLALAIDARAALRPDLRILAMSATPDIARLTAVLRDPLVATSDGRLHPVDVRWAPPAKHERTEPAMAATIGRALREEPGDVLAFLPGIGEIRRVQSLLAERVGPDVDVYPLAGALSTAEQDAALAPSPPGRRRVVLSTDIAESSLTVPGVRIVVDAGLARVPRFDARTGMSRLTTVATSRASADQRAGRAGRTEPGVAYRLWSKLEQTTRRAHLEAEITQVDLAGLALELAAWGTPAGELAFVDPPPTRTMRQAVELLTMLGALDGDGRITERGRRMLALPVHPRLARMIEGASEYERSLACVVAVLVDERDVLRGRADELPADLALRVGVVAGQGHDRADRRDVARVRDRAADLARRAGMRLELGDVRPERTGALLALAYPDRVAVRRSQPGRFQLRTGAGAFTAPDDPLANDRFVVVADLDGKRDNARIRLGAALDADELADALADEVEHRETLVWDRDRNDLVWRGEVRLGGMLLSDETRSAPPGEATVAALVDRVRATRMAALDWTPLATSLRARVAFARRNDEATWPDWSDRTLVATLDEWLAPYLAGATGAADLRALDVAMVLEAELGWDRAAALADLTPSRLTTAAGNEVPIDYSGETPTARVRVQDLFGTSEHPMAGGVPVTLQLLSPADRPIQITSDLPGFWAGSWAAVRKEMTGRYPKHHWPIDPAAAPPRRLKP